MRSILRKCALAASVACCTTALAQRAGQSISIQHGVVVEAQSVEIGSASNTGALVGGIAGLASGRSSSRRARNALIGSAVGGAVASNAQGNRQGMQYTVNTGSGQVMVVTDQSEIKIGDCVAVENAGTGSANIRRVAMALCEGPDELDETVAAELQEDAEDCVTAKDDVLAAETDEALAAAVRRARILCDS